MAPPNLHEEICGKHHKGKKPRAENEEGEADLNGDPSTQALLLSNLRGPNPKAGSLLAANGIPSMAPIVVFAGPPKSAVPTQPPSLTPAALATAPNQSLQAAFDAARSGQSAASALATGRSGGSKFGVSSASPTDADYVPLPRPRPKLAKLKSANR
jgi:hypothetical protein